MGKVVKAIASLGATIVGAVVGFAIGGPLGASIGAALFSAAAAALLKPGIPRRAAMAQQVQLGEQPRQAILGRAAVGGTLVDAFNYGGKDGTDWEVLVLALADHRCDALEGFFVDDTYHAFTGDGMVPGFSNQLQVFWRSGTWDQTVPSILTTNGPGWTANDRGRGVAYVVVAYKADDQKSKTPVWPGGRPRFRWVVRGLRCYDPRLDSSVGGAGPHRRDDPATWQWTSNPIVIRYNWMRGIYAGDRVTEPDKLIIGRGLSAIEAPPLNVFARANLCDELVDGQPRYRIGGVVAATEPFIDVELDFAAATAGVISQPEGAVEIDPGEAKAPVAHFTDADLLVGSKVVWNERMLGDGDPEWVNTVVARYVEPAQRWNQHSAPVRREVADVMDDGRPREAQLSLDLVTDGAQAQRVAEIFRRFGRLWGRAQVTLGPRFSWIEEGDWITWQSDRYFGGATLTFRVESWASDEAWHHTLTLRQISASVYSYGAPLYDGAVAAGQPAPGPVGAPDAGDWSFAAALASNSGVDVPVLRFDGGVSNPAVSQVIFELVQQVAAPNAATEWTSAGVAASDVARFDALAPTGGTFWGAVSYVISGVRGERRVLGPVTAAAPPVANTQVALSGTAAARPEGGAFVGQLYIATDVGRMFRWSGSAWVHASDITLQHTAAAFVGQGALATQNAVDLASQVSGTLPVANADAALRNSTITIDGSGIITGIGTANVPVANTQVALSGTLAARPASGAFVGQLYTATDRLEVYRWDGSAWVDVATNDQGADTRSEDYAPLHYRTHWLRRLRTEFKLHNVLGATAASGDYGTLETYASWSDHSGGPVWQRLTDNAGARYIRYSVGTTPTETWGDWQPEYSGNRRPAFGGDLLEQPGGMVATLERFRTDLGTAAAITSQGALATQNAVDLASQVSGLLPVANADAALRNSAITIDGSGVITGIGTANVPVANTQVALSGTLAARPASGAFVGQLYTATDTRVVSRWSGSAWVDVATRNTGALADLDTVDLGGSAVTGTLPVSKADAALRNSTITIDGSGIITGIGTANVPVANTQVALSGTLAARPASGAFVGQLYTATDRLEVYRWDGSAWVDVATNDQGADTRSEDYAPLHYRTHWLRRLRTEFKLHNVLGATAASGDYGTLETYASWSDHSGGPVWQRLTDNAGARYIRYSVGTTPTETWGDWQPEYSGNRRPAFGGDLLEQPGGMVATLERFRTDLGTAAAITSQGALATQNAVDLASQVSGLLPVANADAALRNSAITIDGSGVITGIGTANVPVANTQVALSGTLAARPASGAFVGQLYTATDRLEVYRWDGSAWVTASDVTATAQRSIVPQYPIIEVRQGDPGHTGSRSITHEARRGTAVLNGGTWSLPTQNLGAGTATIASGTGVVTLSGIVQSGSYTVRYTHTDGVATDLAVNVTYVPAAASGGSSSSGSSAIGSFSSFSYVDVTSEIAITLPSGVTTAQLSAANVQLDVGAEAPKGSTTVQMIWQRESSPGTWVDVGSAATSSPNPSVSLDGEGYYDSTPGTITCNATATGLAAGSAQRFRLRARVSAGNVRSVFPAGAANVTS